jgi:hypothetical protein
MTTDILSYVDFCGGITSVYLAQVLRTSISSSCWVLARYIFHVLALVVYHQYLYQVYTLESDRSVIINDIRYTNTEGNKTAWLVSLMALQGYEFTCKYYIFYTASKTIVFIKLTIPNPTILLFYIEKLHTV